MKLRGEDARREANARESSKCPTQVMQRRSNYNDEEGHWFYVRTVQVSSKGMMAAIATLTRLPFRTFPTSLVQDPMLELPGRGKNGLLRFRNTL